MTSDQYQRVKEIFLAALERPADDREGVLPELCGEDAGLIAEVKSLLHSHSRAEKSARKIEVMTAQTQPDTGSGSGGAVKFDSKGSRGRLPKARFAPGTIIADRYRISDLLGAGGMGEVYRADDLTLDQSVALKFLPPSFSDDPAWLERFYNEVRLSRQVTHPNVCRVFDIGQVDGEQFISMEFVDGEDLASLLRRIGRLPRDKAVQIARQLCAGLAAAHERGVLHRDLKPANIMLDDHGDVRITDFGISARVDDGGDAPAGTPAYMAPEQFKGGEASVRSDIYSLGLVLYEIFTGKPAFAAASVLEYARLHRQTQATNPSTLAQDMDPIVEQVILRCMEKDPSKRPASAKAVAAALPGGDPLAAALAAGETPSPEMVAAAGGNAALSPLVAGIYAVVTIVCLMVVVGLSRKAMILPRAHFDKPPAVLEEKARNDLALAGYDKPLLSAARGFAPDAKFQAWLETHDDTADRWEKMAAVRPGMAMFWYRESPKYMISRDDIGTITLDEPARDQPGMRTIVLDVRGRLKSLEVLPDPHDLPAPPAMRPSEEIFAPLFTAAGLGKEKFESVDAKSVPPMFADHRYTWTGSYPEDPKSPIRIEAAELNGKPVYFSIVEPWMDQVVEESLPTRQDLSGGSVLLHSGLISLLVVSGVLLAWRNIRAKRGDVSGAYRLAAFFLILGVVIWILASSHVPQFVIEVRQFMRALGYILVPAGIVWMFYLAMEPYVRRIWPETVISWSRLLTGRITDSLVLSHVLTGMAAGTGIALAFELGNVVPLWFNKAPPVPGMVMLLRYLSADNTLTMLLISLLVALYMGLLYLLILVVLRLLLRRRILAAGAFVIVGAMVSVLWLDTSFVSWVIAAITSAVILLLLVRYGLVSALAALLVARVMRELPITSDLSAWYSSETILGVGTLAALAVVAALFSVRKTRPWRRGDIERAV